MRYLPKTLSTVAGRDALLPVACLFIRLSSYYQVTCIFFFFFKGHASFSEATGEAHNGVFAGTHASGNFGAFFFISSD